MTDKCLITWTRGFFTLPLWRPSRGLRRGPSPADALHPELLCGHCGHKNGILKLPHFEKTHFILSDPKFGEIRGVRLTWGGAPSQERRIRKKDWELVHHRSWTLTWTETPSSGGWEVQDQDTDRCSVWRDPTSFLLDDFLLHGVGLCRLNGAWETSQLLFELPRKKSEQTLEVND
uniref:uncharacterized protein LOC118530356 n=1 Tax=Halichoerus grypus TaxID=9711 RepID=UPI001659D90F|nr:uncharacterized protein LOC118530356 [Halichoerus grypus]